MSKLNLCAGPQSCDFDITKSNQTVDGKTDKKSYSWADNLCNYIIQYCESGTIHGIRYFSEKRTWIEKIWWLISLAISLYFCIALILKAYFHWESSPVIVSFATKEIPNYAIPFPVVTICPEAKSRPNFFNYTHYLYKKLDNETLTEEEEKKFGYVSFICGVRNDIDYKSPKYAEEELLQFLEDAQPKFFEETISKCKLFGDSYNCTELFSPIITDEGICYTFNIEDRTRLLTNDIAHFKNYHQTQVANDWSLEFGYNQNVSFDAYPYRAAYAGAPFALEAELLVDEDDLDYNCGAKTKGFKVSLTHPQRMPRVEQRHIILEMDKVTELAVSPDIMTTSSDVKEYPIEGRNCIFPKERALHYFNIYSLNNCQMECRVNTTVQECGCVPFYLPRKKHQQLCGAGSHECVNKALKKRFRDSVQIGINTMNGNKTKDDTVPDCQCIPGCTSLQYHAEMSQAKWDWRTSYRSNREMNVNVDNDRIHMSKFLIFFNGNKFVYSERNELYGSTEFLANIGGLLGLFVGFSVLSFVEIIYYLTLRIICNVAMFGRRNWAGKTD